MSKALVEYRVRPVERYVVTRYHTAAPGDGTAKGGSEVCGEFDNEHHANVICATLAHYDVGAPAFFNSHPGLPPGMMERDLVDVVVRAIGVPEEAQRPRFDTTKLRAAAKVLARATTDEPVWVMTSLGTFIRYGNGWYTSDGDGNPGREATEAEMALIPYR